MGTVLLTKTRENWVQLLRMPKLGTAWWGWSFHHTESEPIPPVTITGSKNLDEGLSWKKITSERMEACGELSDRPNSFTNSDCIPKVPFSPGQTLLLNRIGCVKTERYVYAGLAGYAFLGDRLWLT